MKLPKLEMPGKGAKAAKPAKAAKAKAGASRSQVQAPAWAQNLYRDLRDRHLLIPAIVLVVALVAVPMLMRTDPAAQPAAATPVLPEDATAVEPAVLAEQLGGVRDYRKRLDALKQKNPFDQQYLIPTPKGESVESVESTSVGDTSSGGTSTGGATGVTDPGTSSSTSTTSVDTGPPTTTPPDDGDDSNGSSGDKRFYDFRIDVVIAHDGKRKKYEAVRMGQLLPDRSTPIAMYMATPPSMEWARFVLSGDVGATEGDGHCAPSANNCEFLKLAVDEKRVLEYGPEAEKYSITVTEIRRVLIEGKKND